MIVRFLPFLASTRIVLSDTLARANFQAVGGPMHNSKAFDPAKRYIFVRIAIADVDGWIFSDDSKQQLIIKRVKLLRSPTRIRQLSAKAPKKKWLNASEAIFSWKFEKKINSAVSILHIQASGLRYLPLLSKPCLDDKVGAP